MGELSFGTDFSDTQVAALLGRLDLPAEAFQELLTLGRDGAALEDAGVLGHLAALAEEATMGVVAHGPWLRPDCAASYGVQAGHVVGGTWRLALCAFARGGG